MTTRSLLTPDQESELLNQLFDALRFGKVAECARLAASLSTNFQHQTTLLEEFGARASFVALVQEQLSQINAARNARP